MTEITIALDAMGGDHGPRVVIPAALHRLEHTPELHLILVGDEKLIRRYLRKKHAGKHPRISIQHASEKVGMDELPSKALRYKKDSSMRVAINLVKEGRAQACVSAGNTGALMATARFVLKTIPGINRPAIISEMPTSIPNKTVRLLDLGANINSDPENLFQFAVMGSVLAKAVDQNPNPRISLLNIGVEEIKGIQLIRTAHEMIQACPSINYQGYIEANQMYFGKTDIVVTDGFAGNVALKSSEGIAKLIMTLIQRGFRQNLITRLAGVIAKPVLKRLIKQIDPSRYNGGSLIGLRGIVIKSHGGAKMLAFSNAIKEAYIEVKHDVVGLISEQVTQLVQGEKS